MRIYDKYRVEVLPGDLILQFSGTWRSYYLKFIDDVKLLRSRCNEEYKDNNKVEQKDSFICYTIINLGNYMNDSYVMSFNNTQRNISERLQSNLGGIQSYLTEGERLVYGDYGMWLKLDSRGGFVNFCRGIATGNNCVYTAFERRRKGLFLVIRDNRVLSSQRHMSEYGHILKCISREWE